MLLTLKASLGYVLEQLFQISTLNLTYLKLNNIKCSQPIARTVNHMCTPEPKMALGYFRYCRNIKIFFHELLKYHSAPKIILCVPRMVAFMNNDIELLIFLTFHFVQTTQVHKKSKARSPDMYLPALCRRVFFNS